MKKIFNYLFGFTFVFGISHIFAQSPVINLQPQNQSVLVGETATFSLTATGADPLVYQWFKDGSTIDGANSNSYTTSATLISDDGSVFYCIVADSNGTTESDNVQLSVAYPNYRVSDSLQVLYNFKDGSGTSISDVSGVGSALDLAINNSTGVKWTNEGLNIDDLVDIKSNTIAAKIIDACKSSNEITFEAWLLPSNIVQRDVYARIATLSNNDNHERNYGLMQYQNNFQSQLRTTSTNLNGVPSIQSTVTTNLTHYVYTRDASGNVKVYINGSEVSTVSNAGNFSNWDNNYYLYLANDVTGNTFWWEGTYYLVSVYSRALNSTEVNQNFNFGVVSDTIPFITKDPDDAAVIFGSTVIFSTNAVCTLPITYQWKKNGTDIPGATDPTYEISANPDDNGSRFQCVVTSSQGSISSREAVLTVTVPDTRISTGQIVYYKLDEGSGTSVTDISGVGTPINMTISTPEAVTWTNSGLLINSPARIVSDQAPTKIYNECTTSNEISVEIWLKPANTTQSGPARILTNSLDNTKRNFTISQDADKYVGSLRTSVNGSSNGVEINSGIGSVSSKLTHLVYTRSDNEVGKIFVDGVEKVKNTTDLLGDFSTWNPDYRLAIANEIIDNNHFEGLIYSIAIFNRQLLREEIQHNFNIGVSNIGAPSNLEVQANNPGELQVTWNDNSNNEDGFIVYRGEGSPIVFNAVDTTNENENSFLDTNVLEGNSYIYFVQGYNMILNSESSNFDTASVMIYPPSQVIVEAKNVGAVSLSWQDNSNNEDGYSIERATGTPLVFAEVGTVGANVQGFLDNTVEEGTEYKYRISAFVGDNKSAYSVVVTITTLFSDINSPTNLSASTPAVGQIALNWQDNSTNETGFIIERGFGTPISYSVIDSVSENITTFVDGTVIENVIYNYRVKAFNQFTISSYSNIATIKSLISPIPAPTELTVVLDDTRGIPVLAWQDNASNEIGYKIERQNATIVGSKFEVIDSLNENSTAYTDSKVQESTKYAYRVFAFNADTLSDYSNIYLIDVLTGIDDDNSIPNSYSISQNYPNPFNPTTTIKFGVPEESKVTIRLFNLLGQELYILTDKNYQAGKYSLILDASKLTSGVYIYSIVATGSLGGKFVQNKKMTLLK